MQDNIFKVSKINLPISYENQFLTLEILLLDSEMCLLHTQMTI